MDLYNCFGLHSFYFNRLKSEFSIIFFPLPEWTKRTKFVQIDFSDLDYFQISDLTYDDLTGIEEIGYKTPGDEDYDWLLSEEQAQEFDHIFIRLINFGFIRIHSKMARVFEMSE